MPRRKASGKAPAKAPFKSTGKSALAYSQKVKANNSKKKKK